MVEIGKKGNPREYASDYIFSVKREVEGVLEIDPEIFPGLCGRRERTRRARKSNLVQYLFLRNVNYWVKLSVSSTRTREGECQRQIILSNNSKFHFHGKRFGKLPRAIHECVYVSITMQYEKEKARHY